MRRDYVVGRLLMFVPTLLGASIVIFVLLRLVPGDIAGRGTGPISSSDETC